MEAKELMVGDWLQYYDCNLKKQCYAQVTSIQADGTEPYIQTSDSDVYYLVETYKTIPITSEILEKNRLNKCDDMKWCRVTHEDWEFGDNFYLYYDPYYNSFYIGTYIGDKNGSDFITDSIKIEYVHELQHALRLCGIEKEIIL